MNKGRAKVGSCGAFVMKRKPWYKRSDQKLNVFFEENKEYDIKYQYLLIKKEQKCGIVAHLSWSVEHGKKRLDQNQNVLFSGGDKT